MDIDLQQRFIDLWQKYFNNGSLKVYKTYKSRYYFIPRPVCDRNSTPQRGGSRLEQTTL